MTKKLITILLITSSIAGWAQRVKYKDLLIKLPTISMEQQKNELKEYVAADPDNPNANFRLAMLYEYNYRTADPLTAFAYTMANAEQAKIRYLKARQLVDEREVDRNNEQYAPIFKMFDAKGRPYAPFLNVSAKINGGYDSAGLFIEKMPAIYKAFTRSVNSYDQAVKIFALLNNTYSSPEDLYMLYDPSVDALCTDLKASYDTCIVALNQYLKLTQAYPLKQHQQTYKVKPIETYHLDGFITSLNFLTNNIELWDYGTWVDRTRNIVHTQVDELRKNLTKQNEQLDETIRKINVSAESQLPALTPANRQLAFNLNNLDRQSVIQSLMDYKYFKEQWDIENRSKVLDTSLSVHNAEVYSSLIYANKKADTLLQELKSRITPERVKKHKELVAKLYGGPAGLEKYAKDEEHRIKETFNEYAKELRANLLVSAAESALSNKDNTVRFGKFTIPLTLSEPTPEALDQGLLVTRFNRKNPDGSAYLTGLYKSDKKKNLTSTFVVRVNPDGKVAWLKDFTLSVDSAATGDAHTYPGPVALTQEGCGILFRSIHATRGDAQNHFVYLNEKGEDKLRMRMKYSAYPRFLLYSEKSNAFIVSFKGTEAVQQFNTQEVIATAGVNVLGEVMWRREIPITGTVTDLIGLVDGYMLAGNFLAMRDITGKEFRTKPGSMECNPYLIKLSEHGDLVQVKPVLASSSVYLSRVVKINDNSINLLAYGVPIDAGTSTTFSASDKVIHVMANKQGQVICTTY